MNRRNWTQEVFTHLTKEDNALRNAVQAVGIEDWTKVSAYFCESQRGPRNIKRSGKQCRQRWCNHLDPNVAKDPWTVEEEQRLF